MRSGAIGFRLSRLTTSCPPLRVIGAPLWRERLSRRAEHERLAETASSSQLERIDLPEFPGRGGEVVRQLAATIRELT